ncbi:uncharacterized protein [Palaemon carinicauda]|uniref:uncharacterized protein n=1 Tax=Palaemon carinicauda TaxID=392227 RepID=UPI0035B68C90
MWLGNGCVLLACMAAVAATPVTTSEDPIAQLVETVQSLVASETEIKDQLLQATQALSNSQTTLQMLVNGSPKIDKGGSALNDVDVNVLKPLADQIMLALRQFSSSSNSSGMPVSRGSPVLQLILDELKDLNRNFQKHLTASSCPPPFVTLGEDCYNIILEDMTWEGARNACLHMGADLAQPSNVKELKEYVGLRYPRKGRRNFWIGGIYSEKVWQWLSGDLIDDSHWHVNEPSGNGACLAMFDGWENPFSDFPCENERRAICKRL